MLAIALTTLLLAAGSESGTKVSGFASGGVGLELNGSFAMQSASGDLESRGILFPQWELGVRIRFGQFFSVGGSVEYLSAIIGGPGDDWAYERKQIAADVQWRFWGHEGFLRPWLGVGMAWGTIQGSSRDEPMPGVDTHVWEYLRCSVGLDVVFGDHFAVGPWFRVGFGTHHDIDPTSTFLATYVFGLRLSTAFP